MPRPDPAPLTRPLRLLRTRAPWTALLYLVLEAIAGAISIAVWLTILLIPVWLLTWPRLERRLLPLAGRDAPEPPGRWELRWQDVVLVLLTAVMAAAGFFAGILLIVVLGMLFATPYAVLSGREVTGWNANQVLPSLPAAVLAPLLGLVLLALVLWGAAALAHGWSGISHALLRDDERRLARQVDALGDQAVLRDDVIALERRALERDLHDGAQMHLGAAGMRLAMLQLDAEQLPSGDARERILSGLDAVREQIDHGVTSVREATAGLVPTTLRDGGLEAALGELADALPLHVEVDCRMPRLAPEVEHGILLIAREALTNVVRHSEAEQVRIECTIPDDADGLLLEIVDDGRGGAAPTGTGLVSMHARARRLGGSLTLESPASAGTTVRVRVPVDSRRAA